MLRRKKGEPKIYPDEIFMDAENISGLDTNHFEGRLERPIGKKSILFLSAIFGLIGVFFVVKLFSLQIIKGEAYANRSEKNILKKEKTLPLRGAIYDKNGIALTWNGEKDRQYIRLPGFSHILGYTGLPTKEEKEKRGDMLEGELVGKDGLEKKYEDLLRGTAGIKLIERDSQGNAISESVQTPPKNGKNLILTIDSHLQAKLYETLAAVIKEREFEGGAGALIDVRNGEVLSLASVPEYDSQILSDGGPAEAINGFINSKKKPFLNRAIAGLYAPGSIVKPFIALAALNEGIISPQKQIFSSGGISIPNPFFPDKKSVFRDWKAHGFTDMRRAIAVSSDVYFYEIGGGFEDFKGLGINKINEYAKMFGLDSKTGIDLAGEQSGVAPSQEVKAKNDPKDPIWRVGDTYISSIGQGYFLSTPIGAAVHIAAIANGGKIITPNLLKKENSGMENAEKGTIKNVSVPENYFKVVKEGMRLAVTEGTAQSLNIPGIKIAAKTGTAEIGNKTFVHSWVVGFYPYENPKYAFAAVLEKGRSGNLVDASYAMKQFFEWLALYYPEYM